MKWHAILAERHANTDRVLQDNKNLQLRFLFPACSSLSFDIYRFK